VTGQFADMAPWARVVFWTGCDDPHDIRVRAITGGPPYRAMGEPGEKHLGLEWDEPREVAAVAVTYEAGSGPDPALVQLQWWRDTWPYAERSASRGAGRGWIGRDDPFHGKWITALADVETHGDTHTYRLHHLDAVELGDERAVEAAEEYLPRHRRTLRLRLLFGDAEPKVASIRALSPSRWCEGAFEVHLGLDGRTGDGSGRASAWNGEILDGAEWSLQATNGATSHALSLRYTDVDAESPQRTVLTIAAGSATTSVLIADVLADGCVWLPHLGAAVCLAGVDVAQHIGRVRSSPAPPIYDRVFDEPEQTRGRAFAETPRLRKTLQRRPIGRYIPLGMEGNRFEFALRHNGHLFVSKGAMKAAGRDVVDLLWPGAETHFLFPSGDYPDRREREDGATQSLLDGYLPIVTTRWVDRDIEYTQEAFCAYLQRDCGTRLALRGDEPTVCCMRFSIRNTTNDPLPAVLWLSVEPGERVELREGLLTATARLRRFEVKPSRAWLAQADGPQRPDEFRWTTIAYPESRPRMLLRPGSGGMLSTAPCPHDEQGAYTTPTAARFDAVLPGGASTELTALIPFQTLTSPEAVVALQSLDYDEARADVERFWRGFTEAGAAFDTPDELVTDLLRAAATHVLITADKDPASGLYVLPAATFDYGACGNEACIQIRQMDYQGYHDMAEAYLDGLSVPQGSALMDGNFASAEGAFQALNIYNGKWETNTFGYNLDHGFILTAMGEHYLITRDAAWLSRVADRIVAGCDYVTREREATKVETDGARDAAWGLLPAGHLEDNPEWRHWFAVNAHAYRGMQLGALVLAEAGHADAARIASDAEEYKADILAAVGRATERSPSARLSDGSYVPHIPTRTHIHGPDWGWFREAAYGPLHLVDAHLLPPDSPEAEWIHRYLEDRMYVSRDYGRPVDVTRGWFSGGGVTVQANLLNTAPAYIRADMPKHAVRALFNDLAASVYEDVRCFTEHPVQELGTGTGPFYKTPDECGFLNWLRLCLLLEEESTLWICRAAPREWFAPGRSIRLADAPTWFGPVSVEIESNEETIRARLTPPRRNPPARMLLRLRHVGLRRMTSVTVNGRAHAAFDPAGEVIDLSGAGGLAGGDLEIRAEYR